MGEAEDEKTDAAPDDDGCGTRRGGGTGAQENGCGTRRGGGTGALKEAEAEAMDEEVTEDEARDADAKHSD